MPPSLPKELEAMIASFCRDSDREETFMHSDSQSHWARTCWSSLSQLRLASKAWDSLVIPLMYESYDIVLKQSLPQEEGFLQLEEQIASLSRAPRATFIRQVCAVARVSSDHASVSRMMQLISTFLSSLPDLTDFWLLFQTVDAVQAGNQGPVLVYNMADADVAAFHAALSGHKNLQRLSLIAEPLDPKEHGLLVRLHSACKLFEQLPALESVSLRACIPVERFDHLTGQLQDLSKLRRLTKLKLHNAGIMRLNSGAPRDAWHFGVVPQLPQLTHLALVLVDTSIFDLLKLLSSTAGSLQYLSLMGVFVTSEDQGPLDADGRVRDHQLSKRLCAPQLSALCFGRVTDLRGRPAPTDQVKALLWHLLNPATPTLTDLCLQECENLASADIVDLLSGARKPKTLQRLLWWRQCELEASVARGQQNAEVVEADPALDLSKEDETLKKACETAGVQWLKNLSPALLAALIHD